MKRFIRRAILGVIVAVAILAVVIALLPNPIEADSTSVRRGPLRVTVEEEGETRCRIRYVVAAPITGRLERVSLDEGQTLAKGEVVGRMYPPPIDSRQKAEAQARVTAAESSLEEAQALVNVARAEAEQCGRSRARAERLVEDGLISREQYEMAETTERTAAETVKASVSRVERARAEVMQARTALIAAGTETWSTPVTLYSPARGIVLRVLEESERIVAAGTAILEIGDASALEVVVDVLSSDAAAIHAGAEVELNGWGGTVLRGRVRTVEPAAFTKLSALGVEEQRVNVIVDFAEAASEIGVGYRVHARIVIWTGDDVLKVPTGALVRSGEDWGVFAVVEGRARLHRIVVGHRNQLEVEVLAGLVEGEQLIVHPPSDLVDGARVATVDCSLPVARSALESGVKSRFGSDPALSHFGAGSQSGASRRTPRRFAQRAGVYRWALTGFGAPRTLTRVLTEQITSRHNPLIKRAQRIRDGEEPLHLFIEGSRLVDEALRSSTLLEALIYTASFAESENGEAVLSRVARAHVRGAMVPDPIMRTICDTETPQGVVALGTRPRFELDDLLDNESPFIVVLDGLQDPGNVGTIVRATEAAGGSGVVTTPGTAEVYGPKALRASMGSAFRLPVVRRLPLDLVAHEIGKLDGVIVGATASGAVDYADFNWRRPTMLVIGNEGAGLSSDALSTITETVSIPLASPVESLNAGIAAAVILFEAARQRGRDKRPPARRS